jgi:hypothetical protein
MPTEITRAPRSDPVKQFSVFTPNRLGRLYDMTRLLSSHGVHVLAMTVMDTTDSAIIRFVVDDPDQARTLLSSHSFPFTESNVLVAEVDSATKLNSLLAALLEAEVNINYLYSFIPHPHGKSLLALSMEDNDLSEQVLKLKQTDISR